MDFSSLLDSLQRGLGGTLPTVIGALVILLLGWVVAVVVRAGTRRALRAVKLNERVRTSTGSEVDIAGATAKVIYYIILLVALVAFFNTLNLERASETLQSLVDQVLAYVPKLIAAAVLIVVAWILGSLARALISKALTKTRIDEKITSEAGVRSTAQSVGHVAFWLVILLFLPAILDTLELQGLLVPVEGMVDEFLSILPNIVAGLVIGIAGWLIARILRGLVVNLLAAANADAFGERAGLRGTMTLSSLIGVVVYVLVFVPALIAALNALQIDAISEPATEMLSAFMDAIPGIFGAALILAAAYLISGFVARLVESVLAGMNFDRVPERLGLGGLFGGLAASRFVGKVIVFFIMLFASVEASARLGFDRVAEIASMLIEFGGDVLLGVVIIGVGFWLSSLAHTAIKGLERGAALAGVVRFSIVGIVLAMGLRAMGLADDIVNLAFGLTLGAVAVAFALSFGLGGREAAGQEMSRWFRNMRGGGQ